MLAVMARAPLTGELGGSTTVAQFPARECFLVNIKAASTNAGRVVIGGANTVTIPNGSADVTSGWPLAAGEETGFWPINELSKLWYITDNAGDSLSYLILLP